MAFLVQRIQGCLLKSFIQSVDASPWVFITIWVLGLLLSGRTYAQHLQGPENICCLACQKENLNLHFNCSLPFLMYPL